MDTPHQEDLTRLLARKRRQPSAIEDERAVRRPQSTSGTDEGFSTARSFPGAPTGLVRLDPARGVADDTQWKSAPRAGIPALAATRAAKSSHASAERCAASPDSQPNHAWSVEMLGTGGLPTFESERRVPLPDDGSEVDPSGGTTGPSVLIGRLAGSVLFDHATRGVCCCC